MTRHNWLLARTSFTRLFETELFSSSVSASTAVTWLLAALATPGVMMSMNQYYFYAHSRTFAPERADRILFVSQAFHVDFAMAIAGLMTMVIWTSLGPDRRDALVLGPLPITAGEQARARLTALSAFFALFAAAVALPTAVIFTIVTVGDASFGDVLRRTVGHAIAAGAAAAFVFFGFAAVHVSLAATLGPRAVRAAALPLQVGAMLGVVAAVSSTAALADALLRPAAVSNAWIRWNPAAWFVGLYRAAAGDTRAIFQILSAHALLGVSIVVAATLLAYPIAYARCLRNAIAAEGGRSGAWSGWGGRAWVWVLRAVLRSPLERGLATFLVATLTRSQPHRFIAGSYAGAALMFALPLAPRLVEPVTSFWPAYAWFSIPLNVICWCAAGVRVAMMLPVDVSANWAFRLTEPVDKARMLSAVTAVLSSATVLPVAALGAFGAAIAGGPAFGALVGGVMTSAGLALVELLTLTLHMVPGTCTYRPGQLRLRYLWPVYLGVWLLIAYALPDIAVATIGAPSASAMLVIALLMLWIALRCWRIRRVRRLSALTFDEADPPALVTLQMDLRSARVAHLR